MRKKRSGRGKEDISPPGPEQTHSNVKGRKMRKVRGVSKGLAGERGSGSLVGERGGSIIKERAVSDGRVRSFNKEEGKGGEFLIES